MSHRARKISISCDGSPAPGAAWSFRVEFRPLTRGFSVWVFEDNLKTERSRWRKVGGSSKSLSWRTACGYLVRDTNLRVFGDLWDAVDIKGRPPWADNVLRCIFVEDEDAGLDYRAIGQLLIGFSDSEVQTTLLQVGPIPANRDVDTPSSLVALETLSKNVPLLGLLGKSLAQIRAAVHLKRSATLEEVAAKVELEGMRQRARSVLAAHPKEPADQLANSADELFGDHELSPKVKAPDDFWIDISRGPCPDDLPLRLALVERWLSEPRKPRGGGAQGGMRQPDSEWPVLRWLLGDQDQMRSLLDRLAAEHPLKAIALVEEVMKRGKAEAYYFEAPNRFSGWAMNVIGRPIKRSHVQLALEVQGLADRLKVPFEDGYRIGELLFLT